ncbi:small integral membrane protein 1 [Hippocampus zosterae]|uniref:small integral membrane protein 1 n=1 Tax=Hippocampus zosterae TaxID=109293 RepID=UPI00223DECCD|nr:small integral membrane protein 1 [Hippocampus zosterae]
MEPTGAGSVQYNRWNEDNINMNVEASQSPMTRLYIRMCTGKIGIIVKAAGALAAIVSVFILGYVTGYYVHRC